MRCGSCPAEIDFALTPEGRRMPVDRASAGFPGGNLEVWRDGDGTLYCRVLKAGEEPAAGRHRGVSHFSTCTDPDGYRRGR